MPQEFICRVIYDDDQGVRHTEIMEHVHKRADGGFIIGFPIRLYDQKLHLFQVTLIPDSESIHAMSYPSPLTTEELNFHAIRLNSRKD